MSRKREQEVARRIYKEERQLSEQNLRQREKARQRLINRKRAQEEAEANSKPMSRVKKGEKEPSPYDKAKLTRNTVSTGSRVSEEARGWYRIMRQLGGDR